MLAVVVTEGPDTRVLNGISYEAVQAWGPVTRRRCKGTGDAGCKCRKGEMWSGTRSDQHYTVWQGMGLGVLEKIQRGKCQMSAAGCSEGHKQ